MGPTGSATATATAKIPHLGNARSPPTFFVASRRVARGGPSVFIKSDMPATIAETVFITNDKEAEWLKKGRMMPDGSVVSRQAQIAQKLEAGIQSYLPTP